MNKERKRVCCNCGNCIRYPTKDGIRCKCAIDDHYIDYLQCFEHWCRRWKRERKWDGEEPVCLVDADALLAEYDRQHEGEPGKARKLIEDAPTVAAVPASKILALRDALYEAEAVTMRGLRNLNVLIAKYEGGKDHALD